MPETVQLQSIPVAAKLRELLVDQFTGQEFDNWASEELVVAAARQHLISRRKAAS